MISLSYDIFSDDAPPVDFYYKITFRLGGKGSGEFLAYDRKPYGYATTFPARTDF